MAFSAAAAEPADASMSATATGKASAAARTTGASIGRRNRGRARKDRRPASFPSEEVSTEASAARGAPEAPCVCRNSSRISNSPWRMAPTPKPGLAVNRAVALAVAAGAAVTLVSLLPITSVAYHSSTFHVAIETAATLIGLLVSVLLVGRFLRTPTQPDLVLAASLLLLAATNLCFSVIPWIADDELGSFDTWAPIAGRLLGSAGIAVGAMMPARPVWQPRRALLHAVAVVAAALVVIGVAGAALAPHLPVGIDPDVPPDPSGPDLVG